MQSHPDTWQQSWPISHRGQDTTLRLTITTQTVQLSTKIARLLLLFELIGEIGQLCFQVSG
jgi:hypothetical protein